MTVAEVAEVLRTTAKGIYDMNRRGLLPGQVRIGRRVLFNRDAIEAFIESCAVGSTRAQRRVNLRDEACGPEKDPR